MRWVIGLLFVVGAAMVYWRLMLGVIVLVVAAYWVPVVIRQIHDRREATGQRRAELVARDDQPTRGRRHVIRGGLSATTRPPF